MFRKFSTANQQLVQELNRIAVLKTIRARGAISRTEIAEETGLSPGAITNLTRELITKSLISEGGLATSCRGRRRVFLQFNPDGGILIGVEIEFDRIAVGITNLNGDILSVKRVPLEREYSPNKVLRKTASLLKDVLKETEARDLPLYGIGVASPGIVDPQDGICLFSAEFDWHGVEIKKRLEELIPSPVTVENDLKAETLGEFWFGARQDISSLVCLMVENGVGAGVISEGHLLRGADNIVSEIGHVPIDLNGEKCVCGQRGCLETKISAPSIIKRAMEKTEYYPESMLVKLSPEKIALRDIFEAKRKGDELGKEIFEEVSNFLVIAVGILINMYDPEMIVLTGSVIESADRELLENLKAINKQEVLKTVASKVDIRGSSFGENAGVVGAAAIVFHKMISVPSIRS